MAHVHLAASGGGHLDLLRRMQPAFEDLTRTWLTTPGRGADQLRDAGERVLVLPPLDRRNRGLANLRTSLRMAFAERPRLVMTSGAGVVAAFCVAARLSGAKILFAETMARVTDSSLSGRLLSRLADTSLVQWEEMQSVHPRAVVCRPALLDGLVPNPSPLGHGTFVSVGTHHQPFDRLLRLVEDAATRGVLPRPVRAQIAASRFRSSLPDFETVPWIAPDRIRSEIRGAAIVVGHAGAGFVTSCLREGKRPLVLPRLGRHGEHVDDHQRQLVGKLSALRLLVPLEDSIDTEHVRAAQTPISLPDWPPETPKVVDAVRQFLRASLER
jgi:UDP-N-acetylglucosamine--N-acetylmuramyl-(pentapeptide) pyrophosphoryl-undecaprenol N-acetylglucosamine transferase